MKKANCAYGALNTPAASANPLSKHIANARILLVEDNRANILITTAYMQHFGYKYEVVGDGEQALRAMRLNSYDAVLMDVQMPIVDGLQVTRQIRRDEQGRAKQTYIIGLTAHAMEGFRERCLGSGMNDYISKPFSGDDLNRALMKAVTQSAVS